MTIEFDPEQPTAAMTLGEPPVYKIGIDYLLNHTIDQLITDSQHEGAHSAVSRPGSGFFFSSHKARALYDVVGELPPNEYAMWLNPGRREDFASHCRADYQVTFESLGSRQIPQLLPHEAFLSAILSREYGGSSVWDSDPVVGPALAQVWAAIQKAKNEYPREASPEEQTVLGHVARFEELIKNEVWPIYERLYQESQKKIEQMLENGEIGEDGGPGQPGEGGRPIEIDPSTLSDKARKILEGRAKKIADTHGSKGTRGEKEKKASQIHNPDDKPGKPDRPAGEKPKPGSLGEFLDNQHEDWKRQQAELATQAFSKALAPLKDLPQKVFQIFDSLLKPNTSAEYDGWFASGQRVDVARALRAIHGVLSNLKVFERKVDPTERDYRFSLLLDASGSVAQDPVRERGVLGLASMFVDVFERLELPYALDAFHEGFIPVKKGGFGQRLRTTQQRNDVFNEFILNSWGGGATNIRKGIEGSLKRILKAQQTDKRDVEFLFVLTDGEENMDTGQIRALCEAAAKRGIIVVGIGIGEGMQKVREAFPIHLTENNPDNLPKLMAEFIKEYVRVQEEW